jgi:hypothetical protein
MLALMQRDKNAEGCFCTPRDETPMEERIMELKPTMRPLSGQVWVDE